MQPSCWSTPRRRPAACAVDAGEFDVYYFAPQKCFASDGGLWLALLSPAAVERVDRIEASGRWAPASLSLPMALENSRLDQTYNTPSLATLFLLAHQIDWMLDGGGLDWAAGRSRGVGGRPVRLGRGVRPTPRRSSPTPPSAARWWAPSTSTPGVDAGVVSKVLRANGIVDTESYRRLGRNQLRIAMYPAVDTADVETLTRAIDHVVAALA